MWLLNAISLPMIADKSRVTSLGIIIFLKAIIAPGFPVLATLLSIYSFVSEKQA